MEKIKYKYKIVNLLGSSNRGRTGSYGVNNNFERQYYVMVQKKDYERARYLVDKVLHKS